MVWGLNISFQVAVFNNFPPGYLLLSSIHIAHLLISSIQDQTDPAGPMASALECSIIISVPLTFMQGLARFGSLASLRVGTVRVINKGTKIRFWINSSHGWPLTFSITFPATR